jgi:hypothetical protein
MKLTAAALVAGLQRPQWRYVTDVQKGAPPRSKPRRRPFVLC